MKFTTLLTILLPAFLLGNSALSQGSQPTSEGALTTPMNKSQKPNDLVLRFGNESNPVDGILGPFTFGGRSLFLVEI